MNLFLIGAGFDHAATGGKAPLNRGLLNELTRFLSEDGYMSGFSEYCVAFEEFRRQYPTDDIEKCLTFLDLQIMDKRASQSILIGMGGLKGLRRYVERGLAEYFQHCSFRESYFLGAQWVETFAKKLISRNDGIVNLNYGCFLEGLLGHFLRWSPRGGYSQWIPRLAFASGEGVGESDFRKNEDIQDIVVYKIHGSANFVTKGDEITEIMPEVSSVFFPWVIGKSHAPADRRKSLLPCYLIAPSFVKIPHAQIGQMMVEVLERVREAKNFVIIGCGLRPEDSFLQLMLATFFERYRDGKKIDRGKVIIVDKPKDDERDKKLRELRDYFQGVHPLAFDDGIVIPPLLSGIECSVEDLICLLKPSSSD